MTRDNLELALKLNNDVIIQEINLIVDYVNNLASDQKITNYELERSIKANSVSGVSDRLEALETTVTNNFHDINEDYSTHKNNSAIHVTQSDKDNWNSSKTYTDQELSDHASNKNLHVTKNLQDTWNDHVNDTVIHVVQSDKDYWNSILNISKQYAKQLFDSVTSINLIKCEELPEEDIQELTIYMLKVSEGSEEENDLYDEYMYIDGEWERIGSTRVNLEDYVTKTLLQTELGYINQSITSIQQQLHSHTNINILNKLSEDNSGNLLYDNNKISAKSSMSEIIDINITNLSNGDTLKYNSTNQKWENKPDNVLEIDNTSTSNSKLWSSNKTNTEINKSYKDTDSAGTTIADDDYFPFYDTSASDKKKSTWSNVKSVLKTYFDTLYSTTKTRGTATSGGTALSLVNTGDMYTWNNKQNAITAGTNLAFDGNTLNASIPVLGTIDRSMIYSTSEKVVGCWTDGRPIYQKTFTGTLTNTTTQGTTSVNTEISVGTTVNEFIRVEGWVTNGNNNMRLELPTLMLGTTTNGAGIIIAAAANDQTNTTNRNKIFLGNARFASGTHTYRITALYTKTTDAVNSYNYANENDYSTSEKIIGTWIDGTPVFQMCVSFTMPTVTTNGTVAQTLVDLSSYGATLYIEISGMFWKNPDNTAQSVPFGIVYNGSNNLYGTRCYININHQLVVESAYTSFNKRSGIAILKYIKS